MMRLPIYSRNGGVAFVAAAMCLRMLGDGVVQATPAPMAFGGIIPQMVVWAWEEPEDLRSADPRSVGVAYLAETLLLGDAVAIRPRHQPLAVAPGAAVMAVVRMEAQPGFHDSPALRTQTANALTELSHKLGIRALQVDFDATRSEREFYTAVLRQLRPQMPAAMPLSITALASWCAIDRGNEDWLAGLPIDEAVPMFFRLGGHAKPYADKRYLPIREPLCRTSIGLSTDESWPAADTPQSATVHRTYLFSPHPWSPPQLAAAADVPEGERDPALRVRNSGVGDMRAISDTTGIRSVGDAFAEPVQQENER